MQTELPGIDPENVTSWLERCVDGARGPFSFELIAGGHSNLTYGVTGSDGARFVLRRPPLGHLLASANDMGREHRIIAALAGTDVPVAPALGYCDDISVNGAPFYVMAFVDGLVVRDRETAMERLTVATRRRAGESIVSTLAAIHDVDPAAIGLGELGRHDGYIARQLKRWYGQCNAQRTRDLPLIDDIHDQLLTRIPEQGRASIVHGDYRLDNCMLGPDGNVCAVLDWEICTLGDPLADLGLLQVYWTGPDDEPSAWTGQACTAPGFPNRAELLVMYARLSPRDLSGIDFYIAFGYWKLTCIIAGVYARYAAGAMGDVDTRQVDGFATMVSTLADLAVSAASKVS